MRTIVGFLIFTSVVALMAGMIVGAWSNIISWSIN